MNAIDLENLDSVLARIRHEVIRATQKYPKMHSPHEGYAIIKEEVDELWDEVKVNEGREPQARQEAVQISAMGVRYVLDMQKEPTP